MPVGALVLTQGNPIPMKKTKKPAKKTKMKTPAKVVKKLVKKAAKMPPPIEMVDDPEIDDISDKEYAESQKSYAALLKMRLAKQAERKAAKQKAATSTTKPTPPVVPAGATEIPYQELPSDEDEAAFEKRMDALRDKKAAKKPTAPAGLGTSKRAAAMAKKAFGKDFETTTEVAPANPAASSTPKDCPNHDALVKELNDMLDDVMCSVNNSKKTLKKLGIDAVHDMDQQLGRSVQTIWQVGARLKTRYNEIYNLLPDPYDFGDGPDES